MNQDTNFIERYKTNSLEYSYPYIWSKVSDQLPDLLNLDTSILLSELAIIMLLTPLKEADDTTFNNSYS